MVKDHLGNEFETQTAMCANYNISVKSFHERKAKGMTLEEALTQPKIDTKHRRFFDHKGNCFKSQKEMLTYYGVSGSSFRRKKAKGLSLEECLKARDTKRPMSQKDFDKEHSGVVIDDKGVQYNNVHDMCRAHGILYRTYKRRRMLGKTLSEALLPTKRQRGPYIYKDQSFATHEELCAHYGIPKKTFQNLLIEGYSIDEIIENKSRKRKVYDFDGREFNSQKDMCEYHGIAPNKFKHLKDTGYSLEECLGAIPCINKKSKNIPILSTVKVICHTKNDIYLVSVQGEEKNMSKDEILEIWRKNRRNTRGDNEEAIFDHLGNCFRNEKEMCAHHGIRLAMYQKRINEGASMEEALSSKGLQRGNPQTDVHGNTFYNTKALCEYWNINTSTYRKYIVAGMNVNDIVRNMKTFDPYGNTFDSKRDMCHHYGVKFINYQSRLKKGKSTYEALEIIPNLNRNFPITIDEHLMIMEKTPTFGNTSYFVCQKDDKEIILHEDEVRDYCIARFKPQDGKTRHIITTLQKWESKNSIYDHKGNEFSTLVEMCNHYGIGVGTFRYRQQNGYSLDECLSRKRKP